MESEYLLSQVQGPVPVVDSKIKTGADVQYSDNSYADYYGISGISFNLLWIVIPLLVVIATIGIFFLIKKRLKIKDRNEKAGNGVLMEVRVPKNNESEIGVAEKMFANLYGISGRGEGFAKKFTVSNCVSFEVIGLPGEIRFFVHCPKKYADLVEKQILGSYQDADVTVVDEYNIFAPGNQIAYATLVLSGESYCPIRTAEDFTGDPMANILSTLSKMSEKEGALVQLVVAPSDQLWQKKGSSFIQGIESNNSDSSKKKINISEEKLKAIKKKISKPGLIAEIRIVTSAPEKEIAQMHLDNIISAFDQYSNPGINKLKKKKIKLKSAKSFLYDVIYRRTPTDEKSILNLEELAGLYHFPNKDISTPNIKWLLSRELVADNDISSDINSRDTIWVGNNYFRGKKKIICFERDDRRRHAYILGQTGTGKSWLMVRMILQDIYNGDGACFIDPHGSAAEMILERIPSERADDVIYFNAGDFERPFGLNIMEYYNEQHKHQIVNSFIALLIRLFDPNNQGYTGPAFQQAVRNSMLTAMSKPGSTLIEVVRILQDEDWVMNYWLPLIQDDMVRRYWIDQVAKTDKKTKAEALAYFISKFDKFTTNLAIRNIIGQSTSSFDFRKVMDEGKILIVNLSKGLIGEENMSFLGLLLVQKMLAAALSREDVPEDDRKDFFFYADEFQNFATEEFNSILSEARKYRLNLTLAHQYIGQLPEDIKKAVFGNVGSLFIARCSPEDAKFLETPFESYVSAGDMVNQGIGHYYTKLLVKGSYPPPFSLDASYGPKFPDSGFDLPVNKEVAKIIKEISRRKYGRDINVINEDIKRRSQLDSKEDSSDDSNFSAIF
ncbi:MAG TPA: type IV secretion system DNA-binding domain-containing protein [Candidatus Dojkabacteria bacterium]|nr:type IV secretion system DNA-binding domain-containing protein [Candidatus Dojkabacteria bacterium]